MVLQHTCPEPQVLGPCHVQIFCPNDFVSPGHLRRHLVQRVGPTIGDSLMEPFQLTPGLVPPLTGLLAAREAAAQSLEMFEFRAEQHLVFGLLAVTLIDSRTFKLKGLLFGMKE
jgi:hypothetical protein